MKSVINLSVKRSALVGMMCLMWMTVQAQVKVCMNYADFKTDKWKPYTDLIEGKEPDSCRVKYDGIDFTFKTSDKEVNKVIKQDVFLMNLDKQLFVNQRMLRDEDGNILPVNNYLRALPYKDGKRLKSLFLWFYEEEYTRNRPFDGINIGTEKVGTPYYITIEERNTIAETYLAAAYDAMSEEDK